MQAQLPRGEAIAGSSGIILQRYLDQLTTYAESVVDENIGHDKPVSDEDDKEVKGKGKARGHEISPGLPPRPIPQPLPPDIAALDETISPLPPLKAPPLGPDVINLPPRKKVKEKGYKIPPGIPPLPMPPPPPRSPLDPRVSDLPPHKKVKDKGEVYDHGIIPEIPTPPITTSPLPGIAAPTAMGLPPPPGVVTEVPGIPAERESNDCKEKKKDPAPLAVWFAGGPIYRPDVIIRKRRC